jgi:hypothetical protein
MIGVAVYRFITFKCGMSYHKDIGYFERTKDIKFALERKKNRILAINRGTNMMNINNICSP